MNIFKILRKYSQFLSKNERNKIYLRKNSSAGRAVADSKWKTKRTLIKAGVGVPELLVRLKTNEEIENYEWGKLGGNFVIKPVSGYGGEGIIVVRRAIIPQLRDRPAYQMMNGEEMSIDEIKRHCEEILAGKYSLYGMPDMVLVEKRIKIHPKFLTLTKTGTPDIRVIVYNSVPIMAMLRVPTEKSHGRANLQQGAIGLGVDLATGITTFGIEGKGEEMKRIYDFKKHKKIKVNGIKIPDWKKVLETAVLTQKAIKGLDFVGVDVVLDKESGPKVLEVNARPGLSIQLCNKAGLKLRMSKVEDVEVRSVDHALTLAKYLFGEVFFEKVEEKEKVAMIQALETIKVKIPKGFKPDLQRSVPIRVGKHWVVEVKAKVDTGAYRSSIDEVLAVKLGLLRESNILYYRHYRSSLGNSNDRPVVGLSFWLKGRKVMTAVNVANRKKLRTKFLLGRKDLSGFMVNTESRNPNPALSPLRGLQSLEKGKGNNIKNIV